MAKEQIIAVLKVLIDTRSIVTRGATTGFNVFDKSEGEWAEELFVNNGSLTAAIKMLQKELKS